MASRHLDNIARQEAARVLWERGAGLRAKLRELRNRLEENRDVAAYRRGYAAALRAAPEDVRRDYIARQQRSAYGQPRRRRSLFSL